MASEQNLGPAKSTYNGFVGLMKWGTIITAIVAFIVILLIS